MRSVGKGFDDGIGRFPWIYHLFQQQSGQDYLEQQYLLVNGYVAMQDQWYDQQPVYHILLLSYSSKPPDNPAERHARQMNIAGT